MRKSSWRVLCAIPMLFFCLVMFLGLYPHVRTDNLLGVTFLYVILGFVYFIIYQVFHSNYSLLKIQNHNDALMSQVRAMERQAEMLRQSNEQVRIYRHDMRHYIAEVTMLLKAGDTAEALMVLANALENAIQACEKLPEEREKKIAVRILHIPHLVLEVVNTYEDEKQFDNEGLPVAKESGHGIGTRSIATFVEKYGAVLDYQADGSMFQLRFLVNNS